VSCELVLRGARQNNLQNVDVDISVQGACPHCHEIGRVYEVTEQSMVSDPSLTIRERAIVAWLLPGRTKPARHPRLAGIRRRQALIRAIQP
jgi:excinuclease UvrABC ATPase subunit